MQSASTFAIGAVVSFAAKSVWSSFWETGGNDSLIQTQLVETLRSQLDRCGPEALGARPCPTCQLVPCETPWVSLGLCSLLGCCTAVIGLVYIKIRYYSVSASSEARRNNATSIDSGDDVGPRWAPTGRSNSRLIRERPRLMDA